MSNDALYMNVVDILRKIHEIKKYDIWEPESLESPKELQQWQLSLLRDIVFIQMITYQRRNGLSEWQLG